MQVAVGLEYFIVKAALDSSSSKIPLVWTCSASQHKAANFGFILSSPNRTEYHALEHIHRFGHQSKLEYEQYHHFNIIITTVTTIVFIIIVVVYLAHWVVVLKIPLHSKMCTSNNILGMWSNPAGHYISFFLSCVRFFYCTTKGVSMTTQSAVWRSYLL